ncbi:MAG: hypothetical protein K2X98_06215, partial [Alphaproteobacteria bacterium]|nr:hypothetical protein [Alphaproteobacteria bacterium]
MIYAFFFVLSLLASPGFSSYPVNEPNAVKMIKHLTDRVQQARVVDEKILAAKYEAALWNLIINGETDRVTTHYDNQEIETTIQKSYGIRSTGPTLDERPIMMAAIDQLAISASEKSWATIPTHWTLIPLKNKENLAHYNGAKRLLDEAIKKYNPTGAIQMPQGKTLH